MKKLKNSENNWQKNKNIEDIMGTVAVIVFLIFLVMFVIVGFGTKIEPDLVQEQIKNEQMIGGW